MKGNIVIENYSEHAEVYVGKENQRSCWALLAKDLFNHIKFRNITGLCVDVGCGGGETLLALKANATSCSNIVGVEPADRLRSIAKKVNEKHCIEVIDGRFEALPFGDSEVGYLYSCFAFHWVTQVESAIDELDRVLSNNCLLYTSDAADE